MIRHLKLDVRDVSDNLKDIKVENPEDGTADDQVPNGEAAGTDEEDLEEMSTEISTHIIEKVLESLDGMTTQENESE